MLFMKEYYVMKSDSGGIQTPDFQNRNLTFYSAELWGQIKLIFNLQKPKQIFKLFVECKVESAQMYIPFYGYPNPTFIY